MLLFHSSSSKKMNTLYEAKFMVALVLLLGLLMGSLDTTDAQIGVCNGMMGNNLPSQSNVVALYKRNNIKRMRIYDPNMAVLEALRGSNIELIMGCLNGDIPNLGTNPSFANSWVQRNILNFWPSVRFKYINVGNEISPSNVYLAQYVGPAMENVYNALRSAGLQDQIKVSTAIDMTLIGESYPPSKGAFRGDVWGFIDPVLTYLARFKSPLLVNIYPYFSYSSNPRDISLSYALFTSPSPIVWDGNLGYQNLFDALLDVVYSAVEKTGKGSVEIVVSETGWPSAGGYATTMDNAATYTSRLIEHVKKGTPKRPGKPIETYIFAMFDENQKEPQLEKNFGIFYPNMQPKYNLNFGGARIEEVSSASNFTVGKSDM